MASITRATFRALSTVAFQSYVHGASSVPLVNRTVGQVLELTRDAVPDQLAFVVPHQNIRKTYQQFYEEASKLASGFIALGLNRGDRVGIWGPNNYEWVLTQFAASLAGAILVNINPAYQGEELEYCLRKVGVKVLVSKDKFRTQNFYELIASALPELNGSNPGYLHQSSKKFPDLRHVILFGDEASQPGVWHFPRILEAGDSASNGQLEELIQKLQPDEAANIQFTSGTTGSPKGATLSHHNIVNNAQFTGRRLGFHETRHVINCAPPLFHCLGCVVASLSAVFHKGTVVFPSEGFDAEATLRATEKEKCTALFGTPTMYIDMLNHAKFPNYDLRSLRTGVMTGSVCPEEIVKAVQKKMNMKEVTVVYGTTETSPASFQGLRTDNSQQRSSTVGVVLDHLEAKIVDEEGMVVNRGVSGEVMIRGYSLMLGYWGDKEKTSEVIQGDRWYRSGDIGAMSNEGYLSITGRIKDLIIRGGENIYPKEIEHFLHQHPKVEDAQVFSIPDARLGEEVVVWIKLKRGETAKEEEIKEYCRGKIAYYKIPRHIMFRDEFPMTATRKVQKFRMREISLKDLHLT